MPRIGAVRNATKMVWFKPLWDGSNVLLVGERMSIYIVMLSVFFGIMKELAISSPSFTSGPFPTASVKIYRNLFKESVYDGTRSWTHCHAEIIA
jgi:hypothetical protein